MSLFIPNNSPYELLERVPNVQLDRPSKDRRLPIICFLPSDQGNKVVAITVCGIPPFRPDAQYALFNREDKSYTSLDGKWFANYADWLRYVEAEQPAKPAETAAVSVASPPPADPTRRPPQAWHEPEKVAR